LALRLCDLALALKNVYVLDLGLEKKVLDLALALAWNIFHVLGLGLGLVN